MSKSRYTLSNSVPQKVDKAIAIESFEGKLGLLNSKKSLSSFSTSSFFLIIVSNSIFLSVILKFLKIILS